MSKWLKALGLAAVVTVAAVMVPLYGDTRSSSVEHGEWARMLLRGLDMERTVKPASPDAQLFSVLSWKNSLAFHADAYLRGDHAARRERRGRHLHARAVRPHGLGRGRTRPPRPRRLHGVDPLARRHV